MGWQTVSGTGRTTCEEHGHVMLSQACPCGGQHGYTEQPCNLLCPENVDAKRMLGRGGE